jgi:hypothetical protein
MTCVLANFFCCVRPRLIGFLAGFGSGSDSSWLPPDADGSESFVNIKKFFLFEKFFDHGFDDHAVSFGKAHAQPIEIVRHYNN